MTLRMLPRRNDVSTGRGPTARVFRLLCALTFLGVSVGCASGPTRPEQTDAQLEERLATERANADQAIREANLRAVERYWQKVKSSDPSSLPTVDFLAMSGGGDYGAFGAGFLVGWGQTADPAWRRPNFDIVTGVSTGALLAPFAYVGTDEACRTVENFYRNPEADWVQQRSLLFFLPQNPSFMIIPKLEQALQTAVPMALVSQMAEQSRQGKVLLISATNLDYGRQHYWSLGPEAERAVDTGDADRLHRILLASAAIPVAFPPVEIDGSLYADGGVTANVFLKLEPKSPGSFYQMWRQLHPDAPKPKARYWIIINNSLSQPPKTVQAKWPAVLAPSLATSIRSATIAEVRWLAAQADYVNAALDMDIEVRVVAIPDDWRPPVQGDFKKETMNSLADLGRKMGADPSSWTVWTSPKGALLK